MISKVPPSLVKDFQFDYLPNTIFLEVSAFTSTQGKTYKILLSLVHGEQGWGVPSYACVIKVASTWHLCPYVEDELLDKLATLVPPSLVFNRFPDELKTSLLEEV